MTINNPHSFGPQHLSDPFFTARMRFHQSWYRAHVLQAPFGKGPNQSSQTFYGNMLIPEDGERGLNFFTPQIGSRVFDVVKARLSENKGAVQRHRLLCNMLSSQPMCFNLFGPLVNSSELATILIQALLPKEVDKVLQTRIEYAPQPASEYLDDHTAFDAFVEYRRLDGSLAFIGIETKLTESFSKNEHYHPSYTTLTERADSPWLATSYHRLIKPDVNQLWRNHLLVEAVLRHPKFKYAVGHSMVIYHSLDESCTTSLQTYRNLLKPGYVGFSDFTIDHLLTLWTPLVTAEADQDWLLEFRKRYVDLSLSEKDYLTARQDC